MPELGASHRKNLADAHSIHIAEVLVQEEAIKTCFMIQDGIPFHIGSVFTPYPNHHLVAGDQDWNFCFATTLITMNRVGHHPSQLTGVELGVHNVVWVQLAVVSPKTREHIHILGLFTDVKPSKHMFRVIFQQETTPVHQTYERVVLLHLSNSRSMNTHPQLHCRHFDL